MLNRGLICPATPSRRNSRHLALLAGTSVLTLMLTAAGADARPLGSWTPAPSAAAIAAAQSGQAEAARIARDAQNALKRATRAIQAMQASQQAARDAARAASSNVPNGLAGLVQDPRIAAGTPNLWVNANTPVESTSAGKTTVTIEQTAPRAVMTWQSYDVGASTTLIYDQGGNRDWIALNRIAATGTPSRIAGQIKADGTVLIINPNGIVFTGTSQINVNTLIATTHDISSSAAASVFNPGSASYVQASGQIFYVPPKEEAGNLYFLDNGLFTLADATGKVGKSAVFGMGDRTLGAIGGGAVEVQAGAIINSNASGSNDGGYVALLGPKVSNSGTITTKNGSIHLLAGTSGVLGEPLANDTGAKAAITGNLFYPQGASAQPLNINSPLIPGGGVVINDVNAVLKAQTGAVNMIGETLQQLGGIDVTTGVSRPGSISLTGGRGPNGLGGLIGQMVIGSNSVLSILPEADGATIPAGAATGDYFTKNLQPTITISSPSIVVPDGALIKAPGAALRLIASGVPETPLSGNLGNIVFEAGSVIDLSGLTTAIVPISQSLLTFIVTPNEIADYPLAQGLIGKMVTVDGRLHGTRADGSTWVGSPIVNAAGYANTIPVTIDQMLAAAGSYTASGGTVVQKPGSVLNVSGGYVTYTGGIINTTRVRGSNGGTYDIGAAPETLSYVIDGGYTRVNAHWNITETWTSPLRKSGHYEPGYIAGASAGDVNVNAVNPIVQGTIIADTVAGSRQIKNAKGGGAVAQTNLDMLPRGAALNIGFIRHDDLDAIGHSVSLQGSSTNVDPYDLASFNPATVGWMPGLSGNLFPIFTDTLSNAGFGSISISGAYDLRMETGSKLSVRPGGSITLGNVSTIDGVLTARGGSISITGFVPLLSTLIDFNNILQTSYQLPPTPAVVIGPNAVLDVSGLWVNDMLAGSGNEQGAAFINGGSISITTYKQSQIIDAFARLPNGEGIIVAKDVTQGIVLAPGSVLDASGGGHVSATGALRAGAGGNVALASYADAGGIGVWLAERSGTATTDLQVTNQTGTVVYGVVSAGTTYYLPGNPRLPGIDINHYYPTSALGSDYLPNSGTVVLGGEIHAAGLSSGGSFSLQAPTIRIENGAAPITSYGKASVNNALSAQLASRFALPSSTIAGWFNAGGAVDGPTAAGTISLAPTLFVDGGFSSYSLRSTYGGLTIAANTKIAPTQSNYILGSDALSRPTGASLRSFAQLGSLPDGLRKPVSLALSADSYTYDNPSSPRGFLMDEGASIVTEAQGSVSITSQGFARILGNITAPAGNISIVSTSYVVPGQTYQGSLWVGENAVLDVSGTFVQDPRINSYTAGTVLDAGSITLAAPTMVVKSGAKLLLKGASAEIGPTHTSLGVATGPKLIWSRGGDLRLGHISQTETNSIYFDGTVDASGGAPQAMGGTMTLGNASLAAAVARQARLNDQLINDPVNIFIEPDGTSVTAGFLSVPSRTSDIVAPVRGAAFISSDLIDGSGFDSVSLFARKSISFVGSINVNLPGALTLQASTGSILLLPSAQAGQLLPNGMPVDPRDYLGVVNGSTAVHVDVGYLRMVGASGQPDLRIPSLPVGTFSASAKWIDLQRWLAIGNSRDTHLTSETSIRALPDTYDFQTLALSSGQSTFAGAFYVPGNLTLTAREIFPSTNTHFLIESLGGITGADTIDIRQNGTAVAPLSAGGGLYIDAKHIRQNGTLWAPLGTIVLGLTDKSQIPTVISDPFSALVTPTQSVTLGNGSLTSVSANGLMVPYGQTIDGTSWYAGTYGASSPAVTAPPSKQIGFNTANMDQQAGAVVDISGGGEIYATEFVTGTGGTRNVLATYQVTPTTSNAFTTTPQYPDGREVYALVPSYLAPVAPYDSTFAGYPYLSGQHITGSLPAGATGLAGIAAGTSVYLNGTTGVPAGRYTLMPGMYATLPGAYRVVQVGTVNTTFSLSKFPTQADGSQLVSGYFVNALTGGRDALTSVFKLQSADVWTKYSRIDISRGTDYFMRLAQKNGDVTPRLAIDGGLVSFGASSSLTLAGIILADPVSGGRGGVTAISAENILVKSAAQDVPASAAGYLVLDADQLSASGAGQIVIGGRVSYSASGQIIDAQAKHVEILTDAAHPLAASSVVLVSSAGGLGITVDSGSVIASTGSAGAVDTTPIIAKASANDNLGSLLRISAGGLVSITRDFATAADPSLTSGSIVIGTDVGTATLANGGAAVVIQASSLSLDTSGTLRTVDNIDYRVVNLDISGPIVSLGNVGSASGGIVLSSTALANLGSDVSSLRLRTASVFNIYDAGGAVIGDAVNRIGKLTFDGAGFYHEGGQTVIHAENIVLANSGGTSNTSGALNGTGGSLVFDAAGVLTSGAGKKSYSNYAQAEFNGLRGIDFAGDGEINVGSAAAVFNAPAMVVRAGANHSVTTTGRLAVGSLGGTGIVPAATDFGGTLSLTGGEIVHSGAIIARSGKVTLEATSGDVVMTNSASIDATGSAVAVVDRVTFAPGGTVKLLAENGNVTMANNAFVNVSASGHGYAGSLAVETGEDGVVTLSNLLRGDAAYNDLGGSLRINTGTLVGNLPWSGFTGSFDVMLGQGDIRIAQGTTLTSGFVQLTTNSGNIIVEGTIDARAPGGGTIKLFGAGVVGPNGTRTGGVSINAGARLDVSHQAVAPDNPRYVSTSTQIPDGGTITLGTTGTPNRRVWQPECRSRRLRPHLCRR